MWEIPYICFFILVLDASLNQTIWFGLLCAIFVFAVMCVARAIRVRCDERWAERIRVARELQDTILQTVQGSKFVVDEALQKSDDAVHMKLTLERLSTWLGQATQEGQATLNALATTDPKTVSHKKAQKSQK